MPFDKETFIQTQEKVISYVFPSYNFEVLKRSLMIGGNDVFMYGCGFCFARGWLTGDRCDLQVFAPTDVLMSISLTNIRAVASSTRITVDEIRLKVRW